MKSKPGKDNPKGSNHSKPAARRGSRLSIGFSVDSGEARALPESPDPPTRPTMAVGVTVAGKPPCREVCEVSRDTIAVRAYAIWERHGRPQGTADRDWIEAEAELRAEPRPAPAGPPRAKAGTVRLTGNIRHVTSSEWLGAPRVDCEGHIERSAVGVPEEVYTQIERSIAGGTIEGMIFLDSQRRVDWFLDR